MFSDIRDFTAYSEKYPPEENVTGLNRYFNMMVESINENGGTVDKFIGDAVMAEFGGMIPLDNPARHAIDAALRIQDKLHMLNTKRKKAGLPEIRCGIGMHYGDVPQGAIGSDERKEFTSIGDTVNIASRVEGLTKAYRTPMLITRSVFDNLPAAYRVRWSPLGRTKVKGRQKELSLYGITACPDICDENA